MLALRQHLREAVVEAAFRHLPIPGRYLHPVMHALRCNPSRIRMPQIRWDRWHEIQIEIRNASDLIERHILFQGYFEYYESRLIRETLRSGDTFLDVGANIGWHTLLAAKKVGKAGRVVALEPVRSTFEHLERNVALNAFSNVEAHQIGLYSEAKGVAIYQCEAGNAGANSLYRSAGDAPLESIRVERGDALLDRLGIHSVRLCKIDVEGAEADVIAGLERSMRSGRIAMLLIEVNPEALGRGGQRAEDLTERLRSFGYSLTEIRSRRAVKVGWEWSTSANLVGVWKKP